MLAASLLLSSLITRREFAGLVQDYLVFGNAYAHVTRNRMGKVLKIEQALAKFVRRGVRDGQFWWVPCHGQEAEFEINSIVHLRAPDINQEIYGLPEYLSALQSALLNENATLFRRRYYENGSHAGYILYATGTLPA